MNRKTQRGFTAIELIITLAIAAIIMVVAVPGFISSIQNNRMATAANKIVAALNLARSEAVRRGADVRVSRTGSDWAGGWAVWEDIDGDSARTDAETIKVFDGLTALSLQSTGGASEYVFNAAGAANTNDTLFLCDDKRTGETGRSISITPAGKVSTGDYSSCS